MKRTLCFAWIVIFAQIGMAQNSVMVSGNDLLPVFSPGETVPVISLSFSTIVGSPTIVKIQVDRTGSATDSDVPIAKIYRDLNQDSVVDAGDVKLDSAWFSSGTLYFYLINYVPSTSENLLIVFSVASGANTSDSTGAKIDAGYITGGDLTAIVFTGVSNSNQPLPVELTYFTSSIENNNVELKWSTATEVNSYGFEVQKAFVKTNRDLSLQWQNIGFVKGAGNSNSAKTYLFLDKDFHRGNIKYRIKSIDVDGSFIYSKIIDVKFSAAGRYKLNQNYPNPFNPTTKISYSLPESGFISLKIYNLLGKEVSTLFSGNQDAGFHSINFDASDLASGTYIYRITFKSEEKDQSFNKVKKMLLIK